MIVDTAWHQSDLSRFVVNFWSKVKRGEPDSCWEWQGYRKASGYGQFFFARRSYTAHRVAYLLTHGEIPEGLDLDHLCRNRACVNPGHLEPVTRRENLHRGIGHGSETHCPQGHPYSPENTYREADDSRKCATCVRKRVREYKERTKQVAR